MLREFHPTKALLVETVSQMLEEKAATQILADEVLEKSGVSRGSMYHHFSDLEEVVETAQIYRYSKWIDASIGFMYQEVITARTKEELEAALRKLTEVTQADTRKGARSERAMALAACYTNERMAKKMGLETKRLSDAIQDVTEEVKNKGLFRKDVDAKALATFIQAYTLGRIVNDYNPDGVNVDRWTNFIMDIVEKTWMA